MRPWFAVAILSLTIGVLGVVFLTSNAFHRESGGEAPDKLPTAQTQTKVSPKAEFSDPPPLTETVETNNKPIIVAPAAQVVPDANHDEHVRDRIAELMALAMNDDKNSLNTIWSELANPDKEIRSGALDAVVQFGDRSVTPALRQLAAKTEDPAEKASILAAADHLDLPTLSELRSTQKAKAPLPSH